MCWLAGARQEKFFRLWIAHEAQRRIFLQNFVNGDADFVLIARVFGSMAKVIEGSGKRAGAIVDGRNFVAERSRPVVVSFNLAMAPMSPA